MKPPARWIRRLIIAPALVLGVLAASLTLPVVIVLAAFIVANHLDYPPGQLAVAVMALLLAASWLARTLRPAR